MYKKRILAILMATMLLLPTTVLAKGNSNQPKDNKPKKVEQKQQPQQQKPQQPQKKNEVKKQEKKQEISQFKAAIKEKHEQMTALRKQSQDLRKQIGQKKDQLETILEDLKSGAKTLPQDQLDALMALADQIKEDANQVKNTAEMKKEDSEVKADINNKDFNNALNALDKVIAKLQQRIDALKKLNTDLDSALAIANTATVPADTTATNTTTSETTPTDTAPAETTNP